MSGRNSTTAISNNTSKERLSAIKWLHEGQSRAQVSEQVGYRYDTLTSWLDKYLNGGLSGLVRPIRHQKPSRLTSEQQQQLKAMVLTQRPTDYGYERNLWTGAILSAVIAQQFEVQLKDSRIYELLSERGIFSPPGKGENRRCIRVFSRVMLGLC